MSRSFGRRAVAIAAPIIAIACSRQPNAENTTTRTDTTTPMPIPIPTTASSTMGPALRGTDWRLVALADSPVTFVDTARAARIMLQPDTKNLAGSGGCNRLFGVYELSGDALRFSGVGATRMACRHGRDIEAKFLPTLLRVASWKVTGQELTLSDSTGAVLARFEARGK